MNIRRTGTSALCAAFVAATAFPKPAPNAFLRINQLGYEKDTEARAYLMTNALAAGAPYHLENSTGVNVFSGTIGNKTGLWGKFSVFPLDFKLTIPGIYTIVLAGPIRASSPKFRIDTPANLYSGALANALRFYQVQRDGPDYIPSALRTAAAHLNDQKAKVYLPPQISRKSLIGDLTPTGAAIDASGGWFDSGDYLKFVETHSYVVALMLLGVRDFPNQMGAGSRTSDFTAEAKFGLDWLNRMWDDQHRTLYYQVGLGSDNARTLSDHDLWRLPQADDTYGGRASDARFIRHRPVLIAGAAGSPISPNLAGRLAADFALCYVVYRASDPSYANRCLLAAEHVFDLADTKPAGLLLTTSPYDFYKEDEWRDDLELGAAELFFALSQAKGNLPADLPHTDAAFYLRASAHWAGAHLTSVKEPEDTLTLAGVSALAHFELCRAIMAAHSPAGLEVSAARLLAALKDQLEGAVSDHAAKDPFGYGASWSDGDSATRGAALSAMAQAYSFLCGSSTYAQYSRRWAAGVLGANAWGASFVIGDGDSFPGCPHHQIANLTGAVLTGAVVEGPGPHGHLEENDEMRKCPPKGADKYAEFNAKGAVFVDNAASFDTVEPAIDLTAPSFLMFAWRIAGKPAAVP